MIEDKPDNPMAFPVDSGDKQFPYQEGMTLRDYFAAAALMGFMANKNRPTNFDPDDDADYCYKLADALLKAREK